MGNYLFLNFFDEMMSRQLPTLPNVSYATTQGTQDEDK